VTNQDWNDQTNKQGPSPQWGQGAQGNQVPPTQGYDASASYGQSAPGDYNQGAYGQGGYDQSGYQAGPNAAVPSPYGYDPALAQGGYGAAAPQYASWGKRLTGYLVDQGVTLFGVIIYYIGVISMASQVSTTGEAPTSLGLVGIIGMLIMLLGTVWAIYSRYIYGGKTGVSYGRKVAGTRLLSAQTNQPLGGGMTFVRDLVHAVDGPCALGYLWPLWDQKRQTFADKLLNTYVIDDPSAKNPR